MGKQGAEKKPVENKAPVQQQHNSVPAPQAKGSVGAKVGCLASGCKDKEARYNFCDDHFGQFKFGLITRNGEKVIDFERKFEHYQRYLKSQGRAAVKSA